MTNGSMLTLRRPDNLLEARVYPGQAVSPLLLASVLSPLLQSYAHSEAGASVSDTLVPCEPTRPDVSLLGSSSSTAKSSDVPQRKKRRYSTDDARYEDAQDPHMSLVLHANKFQAAALEAAASYSKLGKEKDAVEERVGNFEHENSTLKERCAVLVKENDALKKQSDALKKQSDALKKQNAEIEDRLVSP